MNLVVRDSMLRRPEYRLWDNWGRWYFLTENFAVGRELRLSFREYVAAYRFGAASIATPSNALVTRTDRLIA